MAYTRNLLLCLALAWALPIHARVEGGDIECGSVARDSSRPDSPPYNYWAASAEQRRQVERPDSLPVAVSAAGGREAREWRAAELEAVLRVFPNHPRALMAMADLARAEKSGRPRGTRYSMGCWYDRAVRFAPNDVQVRLAYGHWLARQGERSAAVDQLDRVAAEAMESQTSSYNLGLAYCEAEAWDKALRAAHRAYALGHTLPGLRNRLASAGKWREAGNGRKPVVPASSPSGKE